MRRLLNFYEDHSLNSRTKNDVITGNQTIQLNARRGSVIFFGRGQANVGAIYMIDGFDYIVKIAESSEFVILSYADSTLTIKNNLSVAVNYTIIMPN